MVYKSLYTVSVSVVNWLSQGFADFSQRLTRSVCETRGEMGGKWLLSFHLNLVVSLAVCMCLTVVTVYLSTFLLGMCAARCRTRRFGYSMRCMSYRPGRELVYPIAILHDMFVMSGSSISSSVSMNAV